MTSTVDPFAVAAEIFDPRPHPHLTDPAAWTQERLGEHLWSKQTDIVQAVAAHRYVAVRSCHGVGKSHVASRLAAWWLDTRPLGEAFVVTTAPTAAQVKAILWRYIHQAWNRGNLPGRVLGSQEWKIGDELVAYGRKPADHDEDAFQGIHARYVLVILDEACGIPKQLWDAADSLVTNDDSRVLAIGNPTDPQSHFRQVCDSQQWHTIGISAFDSPAFTGEPIPTELRPLLLSKTWVEERKVEWGENSPLYVSKVLGEFPEDADDAVVPWSWANECRHLPTPDEQTPVHLGVDVGAGGDQTVIRERRGPLAGRTWRSTSSDPQEVADQVCRAIDSTDAEVVKIDSIGVGWGIVGLVRERRPDVHVQPVNVAETPSGRKRFVRLRDELWWMARERSEQQSWVLHDVDDDTLTQLCAPKYGIDAQGRIKVEPKDDTRARIGRSPDDADALLLAFYDGWLSPVEVGPDIWR